MPGLGRPAWLVTAGLTAAWQLASSNGLAADPAPPQRATAPYFLTLGLGLGRYEATTHRPQPYAKWQVDGAEVASLLVVGIRPTPSLAVGLGLDASAGLSARRFERVGGADAARPLTARRYVGLLGPYGAWHWPGAPAVVFSASLGYAGLLNPGEPWGSGLGLAAGLGFERPAFAHCSVGGVVRALLIGVSAEEDSGSVWFTSLTAVPRLLLTATCG